MKRLPKMYGEQAWNSRFAIYYRTLQDDLHIFRVPFPGSIRKHRLHLIRICQEFHCCFSSPSAEATGHDGDAAANRIGNTRDDDEILVSVAAPDLRIEFP